MTTSVSFMQNKLFCQRLFHNMRNVYQTQQRHSSATNIDGIQTDKHASSSTPCDMKFVPPHRDSSSSDVSKLQQFVDGARCLLVLTGAGLSTESGIPDYRSEGVGLYARTTRRPMQYQEFINSASARRRYWARNFVGWPQFSACLPNASHHALRAWQKSGKVGGLVTQNVDALHTKADSEHVVELHGCSYRVRCISCRVISGRADLQHRFEEANPTWSIVNMPLAPDGDVLLEDSQVNGFKVPSCVACRGDLIPDVTFFGDNVARPILDRVYSMVDEADAMLVCGSSLQVWSGYRFVTHAAQQQIPVAIVNVGTTRADALASLKIEALCGSILTQIKVLPLDRS